MGPEIFILFAVVIVGLIALGAYYSAKRRKALQQWAAAHQLTFDRANAYGIDAAFPAFKCFHEGSNRYACNRMEGTWENRGLLAFDYHYETRSTNSKGETETTNHYFSAVIIRSELPLKPLFLRPETVFDKIAGFFGFEDINFESAEFSRKFCVKSSDRKWAYDVIHARTMEFLLASPKFHLQMDGPYVCAWRGSTFKPGNFEAAAKVIGGILDGLPDYVRQQQGQEQGT